MFKHHLWKVIVAVVLAATLAAPGVSATSMVFQSPPPVPPPNDNFSSATVITSLTFNDSVDMTYATTQDNEPQPCNWAQKTVWYSYTASASQVVKVTLYGPYDTNLVIYQANGPDITNLSEVNCAAWNSPLSLTFSASAGTTYYLQVGSIYGSGGTAQLTVEPVLPPANDNFSDATVITGTSFSQSVDVTGATTEAGEPQGACCEAPQHTVWYAFTPLENGAASVSLWGNDSMNTNLNAYRADGPGLSGLSSSLGNARYGGGFTLNVQANQTYYFQAGTNWPSSNILYFSMSFLPAPANDNFANAKVITTLPYDDNTDMTAASIEAGEPMPSCGSTSKTIWYAYTPTASGSLSQRTETWSYTVVGVYTGSSVGALKEVACRSRYYDSSFLTFHVDANTTYYFQLATNDNNSIPFHLEVAPPVSAGFYYLPSDPNVFDPIDFFDSSYDPANVGVQSQAWDFGDGATATGSPVAHRYAVDGAYTAQLSVTTYDGRTGSTSQTVQVKTHDVAITKFSAPQSATAGQTRQIAVGLNSKRYVEDVEVTLYKSVPNGYQYVGTLKQTVPVRPSNRTTDFSFSYTFTKDDATIGKVTFKAVATIMNARDALPADNESVASPTKVGKK